MVIYSRYIGTYLFAEKLRRRLKEKIELVDTTLPV